MSTKIFVGNLPFCAHEDDLEQCFRQFGVVVSIRLDTDPTTGRSRRRCLVEMADEDEAQSAIDALNGRDYQGRTLIVNELNGPRSHAPAKRRTYVYRRSESPTPWPPIHLFGK